MAIKSKYRLRKAHWYKEGDKLVSIPAGTIVELSAAEAGKMVNKIEPLVEAEPASDPEPEGTSEPPVEPSPEGPTPDTE